jgi:hypothetical protein
MSLFSTDTDTLPDHAASRCWRFHRANFHRIPAGIPLECSLQPVPEETRTRY